MICGYKRVSRDKQTVGNQLYEIKDEIVIVSELSLLGRNMVDVINMLHTGRPKGSLSKQTKFRRKEETIKKLLNKNLAVSTIGRILEVNLLTGENFIKTRILEVSINKAVRRN